MDYFVYAGGYNTTPKIYLETIRDKTKIESNIYFNNIEIEYKNDLISKKVSQLNDEERERVHKLYELRKMEMEKQELLEKTNRETNFIKNIWLILFNNNFIKIENNDYKLDFRIVLIDIKTLYLSSPLTFL